MAFGGFELCFLLHTPSNLAELAPTSLRVRPLGIILSFGRSADLPKGLMDTPAPWQVFSLFALRSLGVRSASPAYLTCIHS